MCVCVGGGGGGGGGSLQEKDRDTRRLAFNRSEKLQISASTGVCRTKAG